MPIRIFLVDDHNIVRDGLRLILRDQKDFEVVGDASNGREALDRLFAAQADIVTTDIEMPGIDGLSLLRQIRARSQSIHTLVLSAHSESHFVAEALQAGVNGYMLKQNAGRDFVQAIRTIMGGQVYLCPEISTVVVHEYQRQMHDASHGISSGLLTDREREVLRLIASGKATKEIALTLNLSTKTIEAHRLNIMAKLKVNNIADMTRYAIREGIAQL
jgi:DNA-binding NarL/FixJ family response regulator